MFYFCGNVNWKKLYILKNFLLCVKLRNKLINFENIFLKYVKFGIKLINFEFFFWSELYVWRYIYIC